VAELLLQDLPKGTSLLADRGYDADRIRQMIEDQNCTPVIPPKSNRREEIPFSKRKYKKRNLVERCINKLKQFRHIATRYDRYASAYLAFAKLGAIRHWLGFYSPQPNSHPSRLSAAAKLGRIIVVRRIVVVGPQTTRNGVVAIDPYTTWSDVAWDHGLAGTNGDTSRLGMTPSRGGVRRSTESDQKA
jgi:transposase